MCLDVRQRSTTRRISRRGKGVPETMFHSLKNGCKTMSATVGGGEGLRGEGGQVEGVGVEKGGVGWRMRSLEGH